MTTHEILTLLCRSYLFILSLYHVFTGVVSFFFPEFAIQFYKRIYDCEPQHKKQLLINLRPWGALALFAGIVGLFAAYNPLAYRGVIIGLCVLLTLRINYRYMLRKELKDIGGIRPHRNLISITIIAMGILILLLWLICEGMNQ